MIIAHCNRLKPDRLLGNSESIVGGVDPNDTVSSFGNNVTISGGTSFNANNIYAAGTGDRIATSTAARDTVNATGTTTRHRQLRRPDYGLGAVP